MALKIQGGHHILIETSKILKKNKRFLKLDFNL
jgi:hypothetical protein